MSRRLTFAVLVCLGVFVEPTAVAQDRRVVVTLYALAEFPVLLELRFGPFDLRYPRPLSEYKLLDGWVSDKWGDRSPSYFDLFAVIENLGEIPAEAVELTLTRDRKIGEYADWGRAEPGSYPWEAAQWEGAISVETKVIDVLDGKTAEYVRFGPLSADDLLRDFDDRRLSEQGMWAWEAKYEIAIRCDGCIPSVATWSFPLDYDL